MMGIATMNKVWPMNLPHVQKFTLLALADRADDQDGRCYPSVKWLMGRTSLSERSVQRSLVWLADNGHITIKEQSGQSSNYVVHPRQADTPIQYVEAREPERHPRQSDAPPPSERRGTPVSVAQDPRQPDTQSSLLPLNDPPLIPERGAPKPRASKSTGKKSSTMPEGTPTEHMRQWVSENCPGVDFDKQIRLLKDHEFRSPRSKWDAVIRTWMTRAAEYGGKARQPADHVTKFDRMMNQLNGGNRG